MFGRAFLPGAQSTFISIHSLHPPQLLSCLLSVFYYYILLGVVFNPQAPSKGNSPTPAVEEARTQAPPASQPASGWDSRQGKVPHHNCAQPRFSHSRLQAGTAQAEKVSLGSRPCGGELAKEKVRGKVCPRQKPRASPFTSKCDENT